MTRHEKILRLKTSWDNWKRTFRENDATPPATVRALRDIVMDDLLHNDVVEELLDCYLKNESDSV